MSRKRLFLLALPVAAALAVASVAVADVVTSGANAASATFAATTVANSHVLSCSVNSGDTYARTVATYKGTASSTDARLSGDAHHPCPQPRGHDDRARPRDRRVPDPVGDGNTAHGTIDAAVADGVASGLATGRVGNPGGRLILTLSSQFDPAGGFSAGSQLGTGSVAGAGVVLSGGCNAGQAHSLGWVKHELKKVHREIHKIRKHIHKG